MAVLVRGLCGVLSGCEDFVGIEAFARAKEALLRRFLPRPDGVPSRDTFRRAFRAVAPAALQRCRIGRLREARRAAGTAAGAAVAIDGKALRRASDRDRGPGAPRLVSARAAASGLTLGRVAVGAKSNEITAIPPLLDPLDLGAASRPSVRPAARRGSPRTSRPKGPTTCWPATTTGRRCTRGSRTTSWGN